mmetsp:Transcript_103430/g.183384  ORF Transcript_103430/g.183384 Transcript_103430/m.183384 type:complete len:287 (+) Transcript_103430:1823-2683(+)
MRSTSVGKSRSASGVAKASVCRNSAGGSASPSAKYNLQTAIKPSVLCLSSACSRARTKPGRCSRSSCAPKVLPGTAPVGRCSLALQIQSKQADRFAVPPPAGTMNCSRMDSRLHNSHSQRGKPSISCPGKPCKASSTFAPANAPNRRCKHFWLASAAGAAVLAAASQSLSPRRGTESKHARSCCCIGGAQASAPATHSSASSSNEACPGTTGAAGFVSRGNKMRVKDSNTCVRRNNWPIARAEPAAFAGSARAAWIPSRSLAASSAQPERRSAASSFSRSARTLRR